MRPYCAPATIVEQAIGSCLEFWVFLEGQTTDIAVVEAVDPSKMALTSFSNTIYVL
jgi:hypothetical protein